MKLTLGATLGNETHCVSIVEHEIKRFLRELERGTRNGLFAPAGAPGSFLEDDTAGSKGEAEGLAAGRGNATGVHR